MKKIFTGLATFFFILSFLTQVQAEIIWQPVSVHSYNIGEHGGTMYFPGAVTNPDIDAPTWTNSGMVVPASTIDGTASASTVEDFIPPADSYIGDRGSALMYATSSGGVVTDGLGGLQNRAQTSISITGQSGGPGYFEGDENGIDVRQTVTSVLQQRFTVNENTSVFFSGILDGIVNFNEFNNTNSHYANYNLEGSAQVLQFVEGDPGVQTVQSINLNNDNREEEHLIQLVKDMEGKTVEYVLSSSLSLRTDVKNFRFLGSTINPSPPPMLLFNYESYDLSEPFLLGIDPDNPLIMTATLNQVPIPPSLLLMGSGLGGLFVIRRRFGRT